MLWRRLACFSTRVVQAPTGTSSASLNIASSAVQRLRDICQSGQALRIVVESGGCHGFQYKMDLASALPLADDVLLERGGAMVIIDQLSLSMVSGSKLEFIDELIGQRFQLSDNPNAGSSCGCGTSFEVKL